MPTKHVIFSTRLAGYRPVIWGADPVYAQFFRLRTILRDRLGEPFGHLLAEPVIPGPQDLPATEAQWLSEVMNSSVSLSSLPEDSQRSLRDQLTGQLQAVRTLAEQLKATGLPTDRALGGLLELAIEVPDASCIRVGQNHISLVLWGFSPDQKQAGSFRISQYLSVAPPPVPVVPPTPQVAKDIPPLSPLTGISESPIPIIATVPWYRRWWALRWLRWLLYTLGILLLLLFLAWLLRDCSGIRFPDSAVQPAAGTNPPGSVSPDPGVADPSVTGPVAAPTNPFLPAQPGTIVQPDPAQIVTDPDDPLKQKIVANRLIAFLKEDAVLDDFVTRMKTEFSASDWQFVSYDSTYKVVQIEFPAEQRNTWRSRLESQPEVLVVIDDRVMQTNAVPGDPDFSNKAKRWHLDAIRAPQAWDITMGNPSVVIAIIDGGSDPTHPELKDRLAGTWNVLTHEATITPDGGEGTLHGTHVAATAAGSANNGVGGSGVAPGCRVLPIRVGDKNGDISTLAVIYGIQYALLHNASVINLSLGARVEPTVAADIQKLSVAERDKFFKTVMKAPAFQAEQRVYERIFAEANRRSAVIVLSAGNDDLPIGLDPMRVTPYSLVVSASTNTAQLTRASFSNYGHLSTLTAPGDKIYSAAPNGKEAVLDGTSMASPMVAGAVALLKSVRPDLSPDQIRTVLVKTGLPYGAGSTKPVGPLIQLDKALRACKNLPADNTQARIDSLQHEIDRLKHK